MLGCVGVGLGLGLSFWVGAWLCGLGACGVVCCRVIVLLQFV